jgi:hypothetical protein
LRKEIPFHDNYDKAAQQAVPKSARRNGQQGKFPLTVAAEGGIFLQAYIAGA